MPNPVRVTTNCSVLPSTLVCGVEVMLKVGERSSSAVVLPMLRPSSTMVPVAVALVPCSSAPPVALASCTRNVSAPSKTLSCVVCTLKVCSLTPAANVRVCVVRAVKSPAWAVSGEASVNDETSTVCETAEAPLRVTVKLARPPSLTVTLPTLKTGWSSSAMVPLAAVPVELSATLLLLALVMLAITVSLSSNSVSVVGSMVMLAVSEPAAMVTEPVTAEPL